MVSSEPRPVVLHGGPQDGLRIRVKGQPPQIRQSHSWQTKSQEWIDRVAIYGLDQNIPNKYNFLGFEKR